MINCKMKAETKLTVVMWSRKFGKKTTAPSSGRFRRRRPTRELPVYLARHVCCSNFGIGEVWWMRQSYPAAKHLTIFIRNGSYFRPSKHRVETLQHLFSIHFWNCPNVPVVLVHISYQTYLLYRANLSANCIVKNVTTDDAGLDIEGWWLLQVLLLWLLGLGFNF